MEGSHVTVTITVSGRHEESCPPERCTVHMTVRFDGLIAADVSSAATAQTAELTRRVTELGVTDHFVDQVRRSRHRPYSESGEQLPYVYTATSDVRVKFSEFDLIGPFVEAIVDLDGVEVGRFEWTLTDRTRHATVERIRDLAVQDAVAKATAYARSLSLSQVRPVALADPGLMQASMDAARTFAAMAKSADSVTVKPEDIIVSAEVHARFEAS
ncbi:SIMPL domain-containing protein [Rhodococcoides trifolii]|uniref:SIMPL domain-containing protein n=1 Tax=Rhodococcoides trifolii TaxID=908250 RepID=UPI00166F3F7A|nr:SIMPL domain-containing protein [Rhodococcus trifolii]